MHTFNKAMLMHEELTEEQVSKIVQEGESIGEFIAYQRFSADERKKYAKIIKDFNELYYNLFMQTWWTTSWRGAHLLKPPTDMWIYQELICRLRPDVIIETGTYTGASALFMSDIMDLEGIDGEVWTVDITDAEVCDNFLKKVVSGKIDLIKNTSIDEKLVDGFRKMIDLKQYTKVMVILDSCHDEPHVTRELELYAPLVTKGMPLIVEDTGNHPGPKAAVDAWYPNQTRFKRDMICEKYMLTFSRDGFFECTN